MRDTEYNLYHVYATDYISMLMHYSTATIYIFEFLIYMLLAVPQKILLLGQTLSYSSYMVQQMQNHLSQWHIITCIYMYICKF